MYSCARWWVLRHPIEKYVRQIGSFPKVFGVQKSPNVSNLGSMVLFGASISWTLQKVRISERTKVAEKWRRILCPLNHISEMVLRKLHSFGRIRSLFRGNLAVSCREDIWNETLPARVDVSEILHHLEWLKPYKSWDNAHPWWLAGFWNHQQYFSFETSSSNVSSSN